MQALIDLTARQARRVIEEALITRATLHLEPRIRVDEELIGSIVGREGHTLCVDLEDLGTRNFPTESLIGSFCDVKAALSGQVYMFSTCILGVVGDNSSAPSLKLAIPETIYVSNRRSFERKTTAHFSQVRVWSSESDTPLVGELCNIGGAGLACRLVGTEINEQFLLGDRVRVVFEVNGAEQPFDLVGLVANKIAPKDSNVVVVGVHFPDDSQDPVLVTALDRLRLALTELSPTRENQEEDA